ncbi:MAG: PAS domain S-box protein [Halobacteriaceae archaeon]
MGDGSKPIHVVHVDDDPAFASMAADHLERADDRLRVTTATTVEAGLELIDTEPVDCVVSDYDMHETDGLAFLETVRDRFGDLPFVLFTGEGSESVASDAIASGVTDYLQKDVDVDRYEILANRLVTAVSRRRAESNYREIFEKATDGIAVHDPETGAIVDVNHRFAEMLGTDRETVLNRSVEEILVDEAPHTVEAARTRVRRAHEGEPQVFEWEAETQEGDRFPIEVVLKAAVIGGQDRVLAFVRDISGRKAHERALTALHETAVELGACERVQTVYELVVEAAAAVLPGEYVIADAVVGDTLVPRAESPGEVAADVTGVALDPDQNVASRAYERQEAVVVDDIHGPEGVPTGSEYASVLSVPIGEHGVFQVAARETAAFDDRDRELAELLVSHATAALDRLAETAQRRQERQRLAGLFRNLPSATVEYELVDGEPVVRAVNPAFESVFGYDAATVQDQPLDEFVVPEDASQRARRLNEQVAAGDRLDVQVRRVTADGPRTFRLVNAPIERGRDDRQRGYAIYRDVTDREEARRRLQSVVHHADQAIYIKDRSGRYELVNDAAADLFGLTPADVEGRTDAELFDQDEVRRIEAIDDRVMAQRESTTYERTTTINGDNRILRNQKYPYIDATGSVAGLIGISTDVTDRRARQRRLDSLTTAFPDIALIVDEDGRHVDVLASAASEELLYRDPEELVGKRFDQLFEPGLAADFQALVEETLATGELQTMEYQLEVPRGQRWFEARTTPLDTTVDGKEAVAWVSRDVTERKRREAALQRQRDRLDEFASVVSHDLRNPLNLATGHLEFAREECDSDHLDTVADAHDRMAALVETLLDVAKGERTSVDATPVSLSRFATECWAAVDSTGATIEVTADETVVADATRFRQLLENLFRNSIEHAGPDVTVTVGALPDGFYVADDGPGLPTGDRADILTPGRSGSGEGTGFGLSIVEQVAHDHGWDMTVTDSAEGGARFEFRNVEVGE